MFQLVFQQQSTVNEKPCFGEAEAFDLIFERFNR